MPSRSPSLLLLLTTFAASLPERCRMAWRAFSSPEEGRFTGYRWTATEDSEVRPEHPAAEGADAHTSAGGPSPAPDAPPVEGTAEAAPVAEEQPHGVAAAMEIGLSEPDAHTLVAAIEYQAQWVEMLESAPGRRMPWNRRLIDLCNAASRGMLLASLWSGRNARQDQETVQRSIDVLFREIRQELNRREAMTAKPPEPEVWH
jgi:hypothetical protein